ncbi:carboxymuconolactone decarboxylase family protein [Chitinophaga solisilvae]|uniref:Carboxymuconolactone decarboxylase family protein n=1 Tax=Chitinophaga solisilvae TaxID=1233460 RepID=A0A433WLD9_9BACT|nr:carboxymuconolactone decarboxylase family protein [Chitinophaga solisilvae]NSL85241.1 carboxymuconolactone decarboxylase family protein [Chitinophaga solisilvae]
MEPRMDISQLFPEAYKAVLSLEGALRKSGIDKSLYELIKIRASQINGCAFCLNMHTKDARAAGETEQRIYLLNAWQESPVYTEKERAALALTESVTLLASTHVPDDVYNAALAVFTQEEVAVITMAIVVINAWNRIAVTSRTLPQ